MTLNIIPKSARILVALIVGLLVGSQLETLFVGVNEIATGFVMLLQMTALPYIVLSIVTGIASLSISTLQKTIKHGILSIVLLSALVLLFILISPIAFPDWENAEFYSANTAQQQQAQSFIDLFIPANPFFALANGIIPSVVVFSLFLGFGISSLARKKYTLNVLNTLKDATANVNSIIMKFAPYAIFCIGIKAAVTIDASQLDGLKVYLITALFSVFILVLVVLPAFISIITPYKYTQILKAIREPMITAFATGSFFAVIPLIVEKTKELLQEVESPENNNLSGLSNIVVPITFSLPVGGKLLALLFPIFAAWFSGAFVSFNDYLSLLLYGVPQLFGTTTIAMPQLLELLNVSSSMFDFFIIAENLLTARLSATLSVCFSTCLPLLMAAFIAKKVTFNFKRFNHAVLIIPPLTLALLFALRLGFDSISHQYQGYEKFINRDFILQPVESTYLNEPSGEAVSIYQSQEVLTRIKQRGFIRVGYFRDDLPYSFHNSNGKLVGFDIEIFNQLAIDLNVNIEFVRIFRDQAAKLLASGYLDITSGVPVIPDNMSSFTLTVPYSAQLIAFLVKDKRHKEFTHWREILKKEDLILGIPETFFYTKAVERTFVNGKAWEISTPRLFFKEKYAHIDAMLFGSAAASAWSLLNPDYSVVLPKPIQPPLAMAFPINKDDHSFELFMRNWIYMKTKDNTISRLFSYWIEGKTPITINN